MLLTPLQYSAIHEVLAEVFLHLRSWNGSTEEQAAQIRKLGYLFHNVPYYLDEQYVGFDENIFVEALRTFDQENGTKFEQRYMERSGALVRSSPLALDDSRWPALTAGHGVPVDLRPLIQRFEAAPKLDAIWPEVWQQLSDDGQIGEGSLVALPHLVRICRSRDVIDWNVCALAATLELSRARDGNPDVPEWARVVYFNSLRELAAVAGRQLAHFTDPTAVRAILGLLAVVHGAPAHALALIAFSEAEILQMHGQAASANFDETE